MQILEDNSAGKSGPGHHDRASRQASTHRWATEPLASSLSDNLMESRLCVVASPHRLSSKRFLTKWNRCLEVRSGDGMRIRSNLNCN